MIKIRFYCFFTAVSTVEGARLNRVSCILVDRNGIVFQVQLVNLFFLTADSGVA